MTPNSVCVVIDTPIVDALHTMHDGKFLHLPAVDRGNIIYMGWGRLKSYMHQYFFWFGLGGWKQMAV